MTDWPALIADLEAWDGVPSPDLSNRVTVAWGWRRETVPSGTKPRHHLRWISPTGERRAIAPDPLCSMDAAMAGLPKVWKVLYMGEVSGGWEVQLEALLPDDVLHSAVDGLGHILPHAFTIAICKARQEME